MKTRVTESLGITYPIIQGGMAWVAEHNLVCHSNTGNNWNDFYTRSLPLLHILGRVSSSSCNDDQRVLKVGKRRRRFYGTRKTDTRFTPKGS